MGSTERVFLIDTDAGLDDAQALMMAFSHPGVKVIGITTTHGNATVKQVGRNVLRILRVVREPDIPVHPGCHTSIIGTLGDSSFYHGKDGLGDAPDDIPPDESLLKKQHGVSAIVDIAKKYSGELELICLGPLTNIAMALRLEDGLGAHFKHCYIMGGNTTGQGNVSVAGEYNFHTDPEAAKVVLNDLKCPMTLVGWELCRDLGLSWDYYDELRSVDSDKARFLKKIGHQIQEVSTKNSWGYTPCDEVIMACALDNTIITKSVERYTTVNTEGDLLRGQMVIDWHNHMEKAPNCTTVLEIDVDRFKQMLIDASKPSIK